MITDRIFSGPVNKASTSLIYSDNKISYGDLEFHVSIVTKILIELNLCRNEPVGILFDNNPNFVFWLLACFILRIPVALIPPYFKKNEFNYHISKLNLRCCVLQKSFQNLTGPGMKLFKQCDEYGIYKAENDNFLRLRENDLIIQFTTGSCDDSKAVVRTESAVENEILALNDVFGNCDNEIYAPISPLCHSYGLLGGLLQPLCCGCTVLLANAKFVKDSLRKITANRITYLFATPYIYCKFNDLLSKEHFDVSSIKKCYCAGLSIDAEVAKTFRALTNLEILQDYGSTEAGTMAIGSTGLDKSSDLGEFIGNAQFKINPNNGELQIKSNIIDFRYIYPDRLNSEKFSDGFFLTGDIVEVKDNKYFMKGRTDEFINVAGLKVYAKEIENVISEIDAVREVLVFGQKNKEEGNIIYAFIVGDNLDEDNIRVFCKKRLSDYKIPRKICFVDEIPKNSAGKILKKYLLNDYQEKGKIRTI